MHQELCKNCNHVYKGNYCSNCGQKTNTVRLNWHFVKEEIQYTFLHINKGLLYTAKQLFTRPGKTVSDYIDGKRVQHYKPILLVFVLAGLNGLLTHYLNLGRVMQFSNTGTDKKMAFDPVKFFDWITSHYALIELIFLPIVAFSSWLAFKKWGFNYIENIIINCFASGQRLLYGIATFPILYLFKDTKYFLILSSIIGFPVYLLTIWLFIDLYNYNNKNLGSIILRFLLFGVILFTVFVAIIFIAIIVLVTLIKLGYIDKSLFIK